MEVDMYCVKCKGHKKVMDPKKETYQTKSGTRAAFRAKCPTCGTNLTKFTKA